MNAGMNASERYFFRRQAAQRSDDRGPPDARRFAPPPQSVVPRRSWGMSALVFLTAYIALYAAYVGIPNEVLSSAIYEPLIVRPGAWLIHWLAPTDRVHAAGNQLIVGGSTLDIVRGCDGAGMLFLMFAAIVAIRTTWWQTLAGLAGAALFVYLMNQLRIVVLYFALTRHATWFVPLHTMVFPGLFVVLGVAWFVLWVPNGREPVDEPSRAR